MRNLLVKATAIGLATALAASASPYVSYGKPGVVQTETAIAGIPMLLGDYYNRDTTADLEAVLVRLDQEKKAEETTLADETKESATEAEESTSLKIAATDTFVQKKVRENNYKSIYAKIAIAQVEKYANVRSTPSAEDNDNIVGRIYNNCAAEIEAVESTKDGDWFKVKSGDVEGYIKSDLFVTGVQAKKLVAEVGTITATVATEDLRVREKASLDADVVTSLEKGSTYTVLEEEKDGFVKIEVEDGLVGYVYAGCVDVDVDFQWAVSSEEQVKRENKIEELKFAEKEADAQYFSSYDSGEYVNAAAAAEDWAESLNALYKAAKKYYDDDTAAYAKERLQDVKEYVAVSAEKAGEEQTETIEAIESEIEIIESSSFDAVAEIEIPETVAPTTAPETAAPETQAPAPTTAPETVAPTTAPETAAPETQAPAPTPAPETAAPETQAPAPTPAPTSDVRQAIVNEAVSWVGRCGYVYGGTNLTDGGGVDCSGFTLSVYSRVAGIGLSRCSYQQVNDGARIGFDQLRPGDLVFYGDGGISHVAIYIGNGQIVHAKNPASGIGIDSLNYKAPIAAVSILG